jgi:hypothetical protein
LVAVEPIARGEIVDVLVVESPAGDRYLTTFALVGGYEPTAVGTPLALAVEPGGCPDGIEGGSASGDGKRIAFTHRGDADVEGFLDTVLDVINELNRKLGKVG